MCTDILNDSVHVVISPKGGVGKSCIASFIAGYLLDKALPISCVDADPLSKTFSSYKIFGAKVLTELLSKKLEINIRAFDKLMGPLMKKNRRATIVDIGPSAFCPFLSYMSDDLMLNVLHDEGWKIYYHNPIVGGLSRQDRDICLDYVATRTPGYVKHILWKNEYVGSVNINVTSSFHGIVLLPKLDNRTYGADMSRMLLNRMSFQEAIDSSEFSNRSQNRLRDISSSIYKSMDAAFGLIS